MSGLIPIAYLKIGITPSRALFNGGGILGNTATTISEFVNIAALSNTSSFGTLAFGRNQPYGASSSTRGLTISSNPSPAFNHNIEYCTIATLGNGTFFGNITTTTLRDRLGSLSNETRAIMAGGDFGGSPSTYTNIISYVQIATLSAVIAFGTLPATKCGAPGASSTTRGIFFGGGNAAYSATMEYVTIATLGNALAFGTIAGTARTAQFSCSSNTRAVTMGGYSSTTALDNTMNYVTIATTGNTTLFGNLDSTWASSAATSNKTRGIFGGGRVGALTNNPITGMRYFTLATLGNAQFFGVLSAGRTGLAAFSDSHGGL